MSEEKDEPIDEGKVIDTNWSLPERRKRFCEEYVIDLNCTQAAIRAGYSLETAYSQGSRLLKFVEVQAYIKHLRENIEESTGVTKNRVVRELQRIAFSDMGRFKRDWMTLREFEDLTDDDRAAISSIDYQEIPTEHGKETVIKFKLHDKLKAAEMLNKMLGYNAPDKLEVTDTSTEDEKAARLAKLLERAGELKVNKKNEE